MKCCLIVLSVFALGLSAPAPGIAAGEPLTCGGRAVTIDLNDPAAPDPDRDADDVVLGTEADDEIATGAGVDVVCAVGGHDEVSGGEGRDLLYGYDGDDVLDGGAGRDSLSGGEGSDTLFGGDGDDSLGGGEGADTAHGGPGSDAFSLRGDYLAEGPEAAYGGPGDDLFTASADDELFAGGAGNDSVTFRIRCRECGDIYPYPHVGIRVDLRLDGPQNTWGSGIHELSGIENVTGTGYDDVLLGDGEKNSLDGFYGEDLVNGRRGADFVRGGNGTDRCIGGPGRDEFQGCEKDDGR